MATGQAVAYCAPGRRAIAGIALLLNGHGSLEVTEHPWLEGTSDVILATDPGELLIDPVAFQFAPAFSLSAVAPDWRRCILMSTA